MDRLERGPPSPYSRRLQSKFCWRKYSSTHWILDIFTDLPRPEVSSEVSEQEATNPPKSRRGATDGVGSKKGWMFVGKALDYSKQFRNMRRN